MSTHKPTLSQILATAQLAEMAYNADQTEHKKAAWEKALSDYEQAVEAERVEQPESQEPTILENWIQELGRLEGLNRDLENQKHSLEQEVSFLKNKLIEKDTKIDELEKLAPAGAPVSAKSTEPEVAAAKKNS
ncbi:hypothetical protein [Spirosoma litoris]